MVNAVAEAGVDGGDDEVADDAADKDNHEGEAAAASAATQTQTVFRAKAIKAEVADKRTEKAEEEEREQTETMDENNVTAKIERARPTPQRSKRSPAIREAHKDVPPQTGAIEAAEATAAAVDGAREATETPQ